MFGLFVKKDPVCGMKEKNGEGMRHDGNWFCSETCLHKYKKNKKTGGNKGGCCH